MDAKNRIENVLHSALSRATNYKCPPKLAEALNYAVFPGGARIRPKLCLAVACANGDINPELTDSACAAIEMLHCASLAHDDLPCFDNADERRGKPSLHIAFGEQIALLAGDALIVHAFETVALSINEAHAQGLIEKRMPEMLTILSTSVGAPSGISAGQAWECEETADISTYHKTKTGSLFVAATCSGALTSGASFEEWKPLGQYIGEAYQIADDILDATAPAGSIGKPVRQDASANSPNIVAQRGIEWSIQHLKYLIGQATMAVPDCPGRDWLRDLIIEEANQFIPSEKENSSGEVPAEIDSQLVIKQRLSTFDDAFKSRGILA